MQLKWWQAVGAVTVIALAAPACSKDKKDDKTTTTTAKAASTTVATEVEDTTTTAVETTTTEAASAPVAGAPVKVALTCPSPADIASIVGPEMNFTLEATTDAPTTAAKGASAAVSISYVMGMPAKLVDIANQMGVETVDIKNFAVEASVSGGGTGGPFAATPTDYTVKMSPLEVPTTTATGSVSVTDDATATKIELSKVQFNVAIAVVSMDFPLTCTFPAGSTLATINA